MCFRTLTGVFWHIKPDLTTADYRFMCSVPTRFEQQSALIEHIIIHQTQISNCPNNAQLNNPNSPARQLGCPAPVTSTNHWGNTQFNLGMVCGGSIQPWDRDPSAGFPRLRVDWFWRIQRN